MLYGSYCHFVNGNNKWKIHIGGGNGFSGSVHCYRGWEQHKRLLDHKIDAVNKPERPIPSGELP